MKGFLFKLLGILSILIFFVSCRSAKSISSQNKNKYFSVNGVEFTMIWVEGGTFLMGATPEQGQYVEEDERPIHQVTVGGFYMAETETTQELWEAVMKNNPCVVHNAQNPVDNVTWNDCQRFVEALNRLTGQRFRLPTEAEWEFAARGGNKSRGYRFAGSDNVDEVAWYDKECEIHDLVKIVDIHLVKTKKPNELGLYDMSGNLEEFCQDCYVEFEKDGVNDPNTNFQDCERVIRGSSWASCATECRISVRNPIDVNDHFYSCGFRLAL